jgi:hypothetical protein
MLLIAV